MSKFRDVCDECKCDEFSIIRVHDDIAGDYVEFNCVSCGGSHYA